MRPSNPPYLGAAYYPEDWPLEQIDADIALMKDAGMNVMRVGEFAWSRMEPEKGVYDFAWLHLVVEKLGAAGLSVIMGTPTCTPPIWLTERHPEILFVRDDGVPVRHGGRRHACPNSPVYRDYCACIVTRMAQEFGQSEHIIGWQIDNELYPSSPSARACVCPACRSKFTNTMKARYGTIQALNAAWGTDLWSQTYQSFEQIPIPDLATWHHPSLLQAWAQFNSDSYADFAKDQADILHHMTVHPIGTDMMPFWTLDYGDMNESLDVIQFNHYNDKDSLWQAAFWFDLMRPLKEKPFWNTETQTCWGGGTIANGYQEPGFCRANSWLPIALGGEANLYWLWRQHWSGQELMHGAVITSAGRPLHIYDEVQEVARGLSAAADFLNNTRPIKSGLALQVSHRAAWMLEHQPMLGGFNYHASVLDKIYHPMIQSQLRPDVILPSVNLDDYSMIVSPFMPALDECTLRERLKTWIEAGGTWIVGPMSDIRKADGTKYVHAPYGTLEEWAGVYCKFQLPGDNRQFLMRWADGRESEGSIWYDGLELRGAQAMSTYADGILDGLAAVTWHQMGKGQIIVLGTVFQPSELQGLILAMGKNARIVRQAEASGNLVVVPRKGGGGKGMVVVEVENRPGTLTLPSPMTDLITGIAHTGTLELAPYAVMVLKD